MAIGYLSPHTEIQRAWAQLTQPPAGALILLGRVWNNAPHLHAAISKLANDCHVVIADALTFKLDELTRRFRKPIHLLTVAPAREQPEWITSKRIRILVNYCGPALSEPELIRMGHGVLRVMEPD